jgi:hypothetical protein
MPKKILKKTEKYFQEGTKEQFNLHEFLFFSNSFLFLLLITELYLE